MNKSLPIGVFDSGIGGLTVVKRIDQFLPAESVIYFGDTARVPYGSKSNTTVVEYSFQDARFLMTHNVKMIVAACNTASSVALEMLQDEFSVPVIGMIQPGAKLALEKTKSGRIGVIGTYATINNQAYSKELKKLDSSVEVFEKACPLFVPLAEEGFTDHPAAKLIADEYLKELRKFEIDTLILGCTHYPILAGVIQNVIGKNVELIDSGTAASMEIEAHLTDRGLTNDRRPKGLHDFYVSDIPAKFREIAERFLGREIQNISKVEIEYLLKLSH